MTKTREPEAGTTEDERAFFRVRPGDFPLPDHPETRDAPRRRRRLSRNRFRASRSAFARAFRDAVRREAGLGTPFLFLPAGLVLGAAAYFSLPVEPAPWNIPLGLGLLAIMLLATRDRAAPWRHALALATAVVAGMTLAQAHTAWTSTAMLGSDVTTRLTGRILAIEERANGRTRYTIEVTDTARPKLRYAPDIVRATSGGPADGFSVGGGIRGVVRLTSPSGPAYPGGYDFAFHSWFDGIGANGFFLGKPVPAKIGADTGPVLAAALALERMRRRIGHEILRIAPSRSGSVATALITGNKAGIPEDVNEALRVSGLAHILSISGLHMALVAATVMATLRLGFAFFPGWSSRHPVRKYAAAGALSATAFYLFLAGAGVATQRSFVMLAIMLLALTFDRSAVTMRNLALAAIAVVAISPDQVPGPGFQMSFAATAALIAVYAGWQDRSRRREGRPASNRETGPIVSGATTACRYVAGIAVTSAVAGLATGIFAAYHFGRVAPYGLLANLLAMPVVTLLVMPLAVAVVVAMPLGLHVYPLEAMAWAVDIVIRIAEWVAGLSPAVPVGRMPAAALLGFSGALVVLCLPSTWLRWLSLPVFLASALLWRADPAPLAIVSEDARQFAVIEPVGGGGTCLHVNRARPNAFILEQWADAYRGVSVRKPSASRIMQCGHHLCEARVGRSGGGSRIAYVDLAANDLPPAGPASVRELCTKNDLVIFARAPSLQSCANGTPVLSAQMLALDGAAEIRLADGGRLTVRQALPGAGRPWLDHRRYSRAARNLAAWKPRGNRQ
ncbi:MAG: ComEC/Rec2 family competence protein [Oricola sp.]